MSARSVLMALALSAWLLASVVAFLIVAYTGFFGIAFIGLVVAYVAAQTELDGDRPAPGSLAAQLRADRELTAEQRWSVRHQQSLASQSARFFKLFGIGLAGIGLLGALIEYA